MIRLAFSCLILLLALGGCSANGVSGAPMAPPPTATPPTPPPPTPPPPRAYAPVPAPRDLPEAPGDTCVTIHTGECVPSPQFNAMATELAEGYAADRNFEAQWGLHAINAHRRLREREPAGGSGRRARNRRDHRGDRHRD